MYETRDAARELRMQGLTFAEIGKRLGVSKQRAAQCCAGMDSKRTAWACHKEDLESIVYTGLKKWMLANRVSVPELMRRIWLDTGSSRSKYFRNRLEGKTQLPMREIKKILAVTGGTFEQMFTTD